LRNRYTIPLSAFHFDRCLPPRFVGDPDVKIATSRSANVLEIDNATACSEAGQDGCDVLLSRVHGASNIATSDLFDCRPEYQRAMVVRWIDPMLPQHVGVRTVHAF
jgi:hypothetical protein